MKASDNVATLAFSVAIRDRLAIRARPKERDCDFDRWLSRALPRRKRALIDGVKDADSSLADGTAKDPPTLREVVQIGNLIGPD